jgi:hypothetical protein
MDQHLRELQRRVLQFDYDALEQLLNIKHRDNLNDNEEFIWISDRLHDNPNQIRLWKMALQIARHHNYSGLDIHFIRSGVKIDEIFETYFVEGCYQDNLIIRKDGTARISKRVMLLLISEVTNTVPRTFLFNLDWVSSHSL